MTDVVQHQFIRNEEWRERMKLLFGYCTVL